MKERKSCCIELTACFFRDVRLMTIVSLSMKWYVREQGVTGFQFLKKRVFVHFFDCAKRLCLPSEQQKARKYQSGYNRDWFQPPMAWYLQGVDYCLQSTTSPPNASDSVSHLFSATAISHGLDTRVLLQRNPYNRLTVIKETSLQSNKISNFQLTRDAFQLAVLFSSFIFFLFFLSPFIFIYPVVFYFSSSAFVPQAL